MKTLLVSIFVSLLVAIQVIATGIPSVITTYAPPRGEHGSVMGVCQNVDRYTYGVAFFENVYGTWWRKPYIDTPLLTLCNIMEWDTAFWVDDYWTGGCDGYADYLAAFVVPYTYKDTIPDPNGSWKIPDEIYSNAICYTILDRRTPRDFINFAGYTWEKKITNDENSNGVWGPGPCHFTTNSISVDTSGRLHIGISFDYGVHGVWTCSELILTNKLGYGIYRFKVDTNVSNLPPQAVLGLFTWNDNPTNAHEEIDFESSGGDVVGAGTSNIWQNVIQPWNVDGNRYLFAPPTNMNKSVHEFLWTSNFVWFCNFSEYSNNITSYKVVGASNLHFTASSELASRQVNGSTNMVITVPYPTRTQKAGFFKAAFNSMSGNPVPFYSHVFSNNVPPFSDSHVHINLWLSSGLPDGYVGQKYEVIISDFEFIPIDSGLKISSIRTSPTNAVTLGLSCQGN